MPAVGGVFGIEVSATAERQLAKLSKADQVRVLRVAQQLAFEPRPLGCRKLQGYDDLWRVRVGDYRIIYSIDDRRVVIVVLKVGHRREVYR